jgi:predicted permease
MDASKVIAGPGGGALAGIIFAFIVAGTLYGVSFWQMATFTQQSGNWNDIKGQLGTIIGITLGGTIFLGITAVLVCMQYIGTDKVAYIAMYVATFAACMAFTAVGVAAMTR